MVGHKEFLGTLSLLQTFIIGLILGGPDLTTVFEPLSVQIVMDFARSFVFWSMFTSILDGIYLVFLDVEFEVRANIWFPTFFFVH